MAASESDKTSLYQGSDLNKTGTYGDLKSGSGSGHNQMQPETAAYSDLQQREFKSKIHGIGTGDEINLGGTNYTISGIISEGTGEAVIYKIKDNNQKTFALKLYFEFSNLKDEPNYETLKRIKQISDPDILKLYDYGVGEGKYKGKFCYEISEFAEGGDLFSVSDFKSKYTPEFIENNIVREIFNGLRILHDLKIYHCDLKPSNVFFKDLEQTDLLIGDYGSAKAYDLQTEKEIRKTSTIKGTEAYLSPEQVRGIISEKNDYYSLGIILLHLLYPEQFTLENDLRQIDKDKFEKIVERQYNSQPVIDFNTAFKRLNNLIEGLTLINHLNRFGRVEVENWLKGEEIEVKYKVTGSLIQEIKLSYATIRTENDFVNVVETNESWWEDLFENVDTYFALKAWIGSYKDIETRKLFDVMVHFYKPLGKDYVKEAVIRFFKPDRSIRIDMYSFNFFTSGDIVKDVAKYISLLDDLWKITGTDLNKHIESLRFYLFLLEFSLRQLEKSLNKESAIIVSSINEKIFSVFGITHKPFNDLKTEIQLKINPGNVDETFNLLINLFYSFNPERAFKDMKNNPITSFEEMGIYFIRNETAFEDEFLCIEKDRYLEKLSKNDLKNLNYKEFIFEIFKDKAETKIELVKLTFTKLRDYSVEYKYYKSLNSFLSSKKIDVDFTSRSDQNELYVDERRFFQSFSSECENFITTVTSRHNITTLTEKNLSSVRRKFKTASIKRYIYIYSGQFLAFIMAIPLIVLIIGLVNHNINIDNNWHISRGEAIQVNTIRSITHLFYIVNTNANVRSGPSKNYSVITIAKVGQEIEVLETINPEWFKVKIDNSTGYINSKLLTYSRKSEN